MLRKLSVFALAAVAGFAFSSVSASAVTVENPGMHELTGENTLSIHGLAPNGEITALKCNYDWEANVTASGHVSIHRVDFAAHLGSHGPCSTVNDCGDSGWEGQIEELHRYTNWEYAFHLTFCLQGTGNPLMDLVTRTIECELSVNGNEIHCGGVHDGTFDIPEEEAYIFTTQVAPGVYVHFYVEGELFVDAPLALMHQ